ncbi:MAG: cell division protein FtsZ [Patescibacteria group bacterium]|jgi:cell division protein FtsZ
MSKRQDILEIKPDIETFAKIKVIGTGGSGGAAIDRMIEQRIRGVEFVAVNTDAQALHHSKAPTKIHIGKTTTRGLGAGMDPDIGRKAAEEDQEEIHELLKGADMVFITCGLGGGTGTGAAPVIAQISRDVGALTVAVVTKPFTFEGAQRRQIAEQGLAELQDNVDTLITIPNDRILQIIDKKTSLIEAFKTVDEVLRQGVQGIANLITIPGLINVDFADVKAIMANAGSALMGIGSSTGENRAVEAAKKAIDSPLLELSIDGARGILFTVTGGNSLSMYEVNEAARVITSSADQNAKVIFGANIDPNIKDEVHITVIATGFAGGSEKRKSAKKIIPDFQGRSGIFEHDRRESERTALERPTQEPRQTYTPPVRPEVQAPKKADSPKPPEEDLEIPAFIRKKMM